MVDRAGTAVLGSGYSDGTFPTRGGVFSSTSSPVSKAFKGRPVMVCELGSTGSDERRYYKMRAQDSGASSPGYVTWVVADTPDFAGAGYLGGEPTPVGPPVGGSIVVASDWWEAL